jgi:hypothetical protein
MHIKKNTNARKLALEGTYKTQLKKKDQRISNVVG